VRLAVAPESGVAQTIGSDVWRDLAMPASWALRSAEWLLTGAPIASSGETHLPWYGRSTVVSHVEEAAAPSLPQYAGASKVLVRLPRLTAAEAVGGHSWVTSGCRGVEGAWEAPKHRPDSRQAVETSHGRWGRSRFSDRAPLRAVRVPSDAVDTAFMRDDTDGASNGVILTTIMERLTSTGANAVMIVNARGQKKSSVAASQQRTLPKHSA